MLRAQADGFQTLGSPDEAAWAELVVFALPDAAHALACPPYLTAMADGSVAGFLHGFSVHFGLVTPPDRIGCALVAPKGPGTALRERYEQGTGIPCLLAVHAQAALVDHTRRVAHRWADAIGCARAGIVETSFKDETETDLFGEQAVLCGGLLALIRAAYETLVEAGYPPLLAYTECCHEVKQIGDLICERGLAGMAQAISPTARFGAMEASARLDDGALRTQMRALLRSVHDGSFAARLSRDAEKGSPALRTFENALERHPMEHQGERLRAMLPWLRVPNQSRSNADAADTQ